MAMPTVTEETAMAVLHKMTTDSSDPCTWTLGEGGEVQASKILYLAMITYKLLKAAVEAEQLNDLFGEDE